MDLSYSVFPITVEGKFGGVGVGSSVRMLDCLLQMVMIVAF